MSTSLPGWNPENPVPTELTFLGGPVEDRTQAEGMTCNGTGTGQGWKDGPELGPLLPASLFYGGENRGLI